MADDKNVKNIKGVFVDHNVIRDEPWRVTMALLGISEEAARAGWEETQAMTPEQCEARMEEIKRKAYGGQP